jgi:hypothetical protein
MMAHLWEDLKAEWRPLAFYAATEAAALATWAAMAAMGFRRRVVGCARPRATRAAPPAGGAPGAAAGRRRGRGVCAGAPAGARARRPPTHHLLGPRSNSTPAPSRSPRPRRARRDIVYYTRGLPPPPSAGGAPSSGAAAGNAAAAAPVLFLHGVGGLVIYADLARCLAALGGPVIAVDIRHVGMRVRCGGAPERRLALFLGLGFRRARGQKGARRTDPSRRSQGWRARAAPPAPLASAEPPAGGPRARLCPTPSQTPPRRRAAAARASRAPTR